MKSFALWYKIQEDEEQIKSKESNRNKESDENIHFDLHMNFWSESLMKGKIKNKHLVNFCNKKKRQNQIIPFLDVGIKVYGFRSINSFVFQCPFKLKKDEIIDLSNIIIDKNNAQIIFNTDVEIETKKGYNLLKLNGKEKLLVYPVPKDDSFINNTSDDRTNIEFNLDDLHSYIKKDVESYSEIKDLYIRFRIKSATLQNKIYSDREGIDKSFQSRFSGTRILDFKINEERNLNPEDNKKYLINGYEVASFRKIHLLMMESASCDIKSFALGKMYCREVENDLWKDYCEEVIANSDEQILAYHWKFSRDMLEDKELSSVSCLAKVTYSKTGVRSIIAYSIIVIALGMISNMILNIISYIMSEQSINNNNMAVYVVEIFLAIFLIALGVFLNFKEKKK